MSLIHTAELNKVGTFVDSFTAGAWVGTYAPTGTAAAEIEALSRAVARAMR